MFDATIAGSLPRPDWLAEPEKLKGGWKLQGTELREGQNRAAREWIKHCLLYTSPSPRDAHESRMPSSA